MKKIYNYFKDNPIFAVYMTILIVSSFFFATYDNPHSIVLIILGGITNIICVLLAFGYGLIGGIIAVLSNLIGGIGNLYLYFNGQDTYFLPVSMFTLFNAITCGIIAYLSRERREKEKDLLKLAQVDALTEVYNHRHFQSLYPKVFEACKFKNESLNVIAIDVDHFKVINDYFGHKAGDRILMEISKILKQSVRDHDLVFRYGGDEFMILLPNVSLDSSMKVCERISKEINKYTDDHIENSIKNFKVSVSIGIANYPMHSSNEKTLVSQADMALYDSKHLGRNKISVYDNSVENYMENNPQINDYLRSLLTLINSKDNYTFGHSLRVAEYCARFSQYLNLSEKEILDMRVIGLLHDIGKIEMPDEIIGKTGKLDSYEYEKIKEHPVASSKILDSYISSNTIVSSVMQHHERFDGTGYPRGLAGDEISKYARILNVVDSYDAMVTDRSYNITKSKEEAIKELLLNKAKQFDPVYTDAFVKFLKATYDQSFDIENQKVTLSSG